jgi:hypothetical protein
MNFTAPSTGQKWYDRIGWPVILGGVNSALVLAASFGLEVSAEQIAGINTVTALLFSLYARQKVTPWKPDKFGDWSAEKLAAEAETVDPE